MELEGLKEKPDIASVVAKTVEPVTQQTMDIPRVLVGPKGEVKSGFSPFTLKSSAYTSSVAEPPADYHVSPSDKSNMAKYVFGGFERCLYPVQKFDSEAERKLAVILDRDAIKWFKSAKGQFQIFYRHGADHIEYQPDFVAETGYAIFMLEPKASKQLDDPIVLAKMEAALNWCVNASAQAQSYGGKPWRYLLIPHDEIATNITLDALAQRRLNS